MKVAISQPLDPQAVIPTLGNMLPGYKFSMRGSKVVVAEKSAAVGATILFRKNKLVVNGNFPNMGLQLLFVLSIVFLGILIPLVIYFLTAYRSQKASEKEVAGALEAMLSGAPVHPQAAMAPGYAPQAAIAPQAAYAPPAGYAPQAAYAPPAGYAPQAAYAPQPHV